MYQSFGHVLTFLQTNILVDPDRHARIAGLGVALISSPMPGVDIDRFFHGAAPELAALRRTRSSGTVATKASDVYAFAVLSWEVGMWFVYALDRSLNGAVHRQTFNGRVPFPDENKVAAIFSMLNGRRPTRPDHPELSDRLWKTIECCWNADPARRKTITEVIAVLEVEVTARQSESYGLCQNRT